MKRKRLLQAAKDEAVALLAGHDTRFGAMYVLNQILQETSMFKMSAISAQDRASIVDLTRSVNNYMRTWKGYLKDAGAELRSVRGGPAMRSFLTEYNEQLAKLDEAKSVLLRAISEKEDELVKKSIEYHKLIDRATSHGDRDKKSGLSHTSRKISNLKAGLIGLDKGIRTIKELRKKLEEN